MNEDSKLKAISSAAMEEVRRSYYKEAPMLSSPNKDGAHCSPGSSPASHAKNNEHIVATKISEKKRKKRRVSSRSSSSSSKRSGRSASPGKADRRRNYRQRAGSASRDDSTRPGKAKKKTGRKSRDARSSSRSSSRSPSRSKSPTSVTKRRRSRSIDSRSPPRKPSPSPVKVSKKAMKSKSKSPSPDRKVRKASAIAKDVANKPTESGNTSNLAGERGVPEVQATAKPRNAIEEKLLSISNSKLSPSRSRSNSKSPTRKRSRSRSPVSRRRSKSPRRKRDSPLRRRRDSPSPPRKRNRSPPRKRRSRSPSRRKASPRRRSPSRSRSRTRSRSPVRRRRSPSPTRKRESRSPPRKHRSPSPAKIRRSSSPEKYRRSRSPDRSAKRSNADAGSGKRRSPYWGNRGIKRYRDSRSPSPEARYDTDAGFTRAVLPQQLKDKTNSTQGSAAANKKERIVTTEEIEQRLAKHMKNLQDKATEEARKINLPGYLNPAMVNVHQFKQVQEKRKLLWSKAKEKTDASQWAGAFEGDDGADGKFRRLMGIHDEMKAAPAGTNTQVLKSRQVLEDLEKEYEKSRAFQLSRGAGGLTGIGLGFGSAAPPDS